MEDVIEALAGVGWRLSMVAVYPMAWPMSEVPADQDVEFDYLVEFSRSGKEGARGVGNTLVKAFVKAVAACTLSDEQRSGEIYNPMKVGDDGVERPCDVDEDPPREE
jgi:hypothetical protein